MIDQIFSVRLSLILNADYHTTFLIILQCAGKSITSLNDKIGKQGCVPYMHQTKMHNDTGNKILECRNIDLVYFLLGILYTLPDQNELEQIFQ